MSDKSKIIAAHNDEFRKQFHKPKIIGPQIPGHYLLTRGVLALPKEDMFEIIEKVRDFDDFNEDNDPHGEHDMGKFRQNGVDIMWKIDYYDVDYKYGSEDPSNLAITRRVLTTMISYEY